MMYESVTKIQENQYNDFSSYPQDLADHMNQNGGEQ